MPRTQNRFIMIWLFIFAFLVAFLVVFGGFVRLTRSGLSIVEWNPVSGTIPPIGAVAWQNEFLKYQQTPEFKIINPQMTVEEYRYIFYIEWIHRFLARLAGLVYALPAFYFLVKKTIPFKEFGIYFVIGLLFIAQAFMGWYMVASGLVDRPSVSHFRLALHLLFALAILGLSLWVGLGHRYGFGMRATMKEPIESHRGSFHPAATPVLFASLALIILVLQMTYGAMTAGLKAGYVSNTWPLMFGMLVPEGIFDSAFAFAESARTIVFIHRWFGLLGLIAVPLVYWLAKRAGYPRAILRGLTWLICLVVVQIGLGILTVLYQVPIVIALLHQANALALFALGVFFAHRLRV